jgi:hypothetical protein
MIVTNGHDHCLVKSLNGLEMSGGLTLFYVRSRKIKVTMDEDVPK